jgi:hypothetical protein
MLVLKKKRDIKQNKIIRPVKATRQPTIIDTTPKSRKVIKKGGCCGRSN